MARASDILKVAKKEIGTKERPTGSNCVKYNTEFYGVKVKGSAYPWCAVFVWWVFKHANASLLFYGGKKTASCSNIGDWGINSKRTVGKTKGKAGDIILFDFNANGGSDHVGLIEKKNSDGSYTTIEGNTSLTSNDNGGKVMRRKRYLSQINYIIRPKYAAEKKKPAYTKYPTVRKGNKNAYVKRLKTKLKSRGYTGMDNSSGFGNGTLKAVKKFQKIHKLKVDGVVGQKTWKLVYTAPYSKKAKKKK